MVAQGRTITGGTGVLGTHNLLELKLAGPSAADLEAFREKYFYIIRAIPLDEQPKERTLMNSRNLPPSSLALRKLVQPPIIATVARPSKS